jgi:hypothetical protein
MNDLFRHGTLSICVAATLCCGSAIAGVTEGIEAVGRGAVVYSDDFALRKIKQSGRAAAKTSLVEEAATEESPLPVGEGWG